MAEKLVWQCPSRACVYGGCGGWSAGGGTGCGGCCDCLGGCRAGSELQELYDAALAAVMHGVSRDGAVAWPLGQDEALAIAAEYFKAMEVMRGGDPEDRS